MKRSSTRTGPPQLEQLETRQVPSAASAGVAPRIVDSTEALQDFVTAEFQRILHRAPDAAGLADWVNRMQNGATPQDVEAGIAASPEDIQNHQSNQSLWIDGLYNDLLGRAPDANGFSYWMDKMNHGMRPSDVALGFSTSIERDNLIINQDYSSFLGRAPDSSGASHWLNVLEQGGTWNQVASGMIGSDEFFADQGNNNRNFIIATYQDVLHRPPTESEISYWESQMGPQGPFGTK